MTLYVLAGRRPDPPDADVKRFPIENRNMVATKIGNLFAAQNATTLVASAACGADLIAMEVAGQRKMRRLVVLPFAADRFRETSVTDRPGDWEKLYKDVIADVEQRGDLVVLKCSPGNDDAYRLANQAIITEGAKLAGTGQAVRICLVWEGASRGSNDITYQLAESARREHGWPIDEVLTI